MARIIYGGQLVNLCLLSKDLLNFEPPYRKCWLRPCPNFVIFTFDLKYMYTLLRAHNNRDLVGSLISICDWILENRLKCHTGPIPFYWPS